jgi:hypothetical protein
MSEGNDNSEPEVGLPIIIDDAAENELPASSSSNAIGILMNEMMLVEVPASPATPPAFNFKAAAVSAEEWCHWYRFLISCIGGHAVFYSR